MSKSPSINFPIAPNQVPLGNRFPKSILVLTVLKNIINIRKNIYINLNSYTSAFKDLLDDATSQGKNFIHLFID